jgi:DNA-binding NarL/FixJ family response regulator
VIRVLLADDQAMVRDGFRMILNAQEDIEVIGEASNGHEAVSMTRELEPDVVLMDIRMPELDGLEATRQLFGGSQRARVLILTTFDVDEYVYAALKAGASGFLLKDSPRGQLLNAVRIVAAGDELLDPAITRRFVEEFVRRPGAGGGIPPEVAGLSERELEVFRLLAGGLSNAEIAEKLYLSPATVKSHVANVLQKLRLRDRVQAVVLAYESGLVRPGERNPRERSRGRDA